MADTKTSALASGPTPIDGDDLLMVVDVSDTTMAPTGTNKKLPAGSLTIAPGQITGFDESVDDRVAALLVAGTNVTLVYDDVAHTLTVGAAGGGGSGTVTSASVATANGFAGTVANATTTPAITISTTVTGVLKGNGTAVAAAVADTDYATPAGVTSYVAGVVAGYQPLDGELTAIAGLTSAADRLPYFTGSGTASLATFTAAGRALIDDADAAAQRTTLGLVIGTNVQAWDADLDGLAAVSTTGFVKRTGPGTFTAAALVAGDVPDLSATYQPLDSDLTAVAGLSATGLVARTGTGAMSARTITGTSNRLSVTNGDGVSGNPTLDISSGYVGQATITTLGTITTGTWAGTTIAVANGGTGAATLTGVLKGNGTAAFTAATEGTDYLSGASNKLPLPFSFGGTGTPGVANDVTPWLYVPYAGTAIRLTLSCKTAPTGNFTVVIRRSADGGATFPDTIATATVSSGNKIATTTTMTNSALAAGDHLRCDVTAVNGAADFTARLGTLSRNQ